MTAAQLQAMTKEQLVKHCLRLQEKVAQRDAVIKATQAKNAELKAQLQHENQP